MELLLLLLIVPFIWLLLLPVRVMGARKVPLRSTGLLALAVVGGIMFLNAKGEAPADYAAGDMELRALLE